MPTSYHIFLDGEVTAAFPEAVIQAMLSSGAITGETPLCKEGTDVWDKAKCLISTPPPTSLHPSPLPAAPATPQTICVQAPKRPKRRWGGADTIGLILIVLFLLWYCDSKFSVSRTKEQDQSWVSGGSLHKATMGEWKQASYANKLATVSDWLVAARREKYSDLASVKADAKLFILDMDEGARNPELASIKAAEFAAGVMVIWNNSDDPTSLTTKAPESFKAKFETTKGSFTIQVSRSLSPTGADRFYNLVKSGFFQDIAFFRVIPGFMSQFGIHGDPAVSAKWRDAKIGDDPVTGRNVRGTVTFAMAGPNTRTTQLFINLVDNTNLDGLRFSPFGKVVDGMDVVDKLNGEYGEGAPRGRGPDQGRIQTEGNAYLKKDFPNLDYIKFATVAE